MFTVGHHRPRRTGQPGHRHRRRGHLGGDRGPPDRLPARAVRRLQPPREPGGHVGEPGRDPGLGARGAGPPPAGRASSTPCPTSTPRGRSGRPTWPRATPPTRSCCCSGHPSRGSRGWSGSSPSWTARPCTWPLAPSTASSQSRLCLRMGFTALNRIAKILGWEVDPDPSPEGPIALTFEEFDEAVAMLEQRGVPDGADRRGGLARLPGVAGQLRDGGLPAGRPADRPAGPVVGHTSPPAFRAGGPQPTAPAVPVRAGPAPPRRGRGTDDPATRWDNPVTGARRLGTSGDRSLSRGCSTGR